MGLIRALVTSFNGGELSPRMMGRVDTAIYQVALATCENFVPTVEGPIVKRPGFEYICTAHESALLLGTFRFNLTQDYVIEWGEELARFYTNGGRIETAPGVAYQISTPYAAADAPMISTQQSFDRLYLAHGSYPLAALRRTGGATFVHEAITCRLGPFSDQNSDDTITVSVSATTGTTTITASAPIFEAGHVGELFEIEAKDFSTTPPWTAGAAKAAGVEVRSAGKIYTTLAGGTSGSDTPVHADGAELDGPGGVLWEYAYDRYGIVRIETVAPDGLSATGTVERRLPTHVIAKPTWKWAHGAFSNKEGWPDLVSLWVGRLMLVKGYDLLGSVVGDYGGGSINFQRRTSEGLTAADLSFRRTLATEDPPLWMTPDRALLLGTASREMKVGAINAAAAVSGDNIEAMPQSFYGCASVFPVQIGQSTIFVQRGGRKLREAGYSFTSDRYEAVNMNLWSRHITASGIKQFAFQKEPEELLFAVRGDGQLAVHPHNPDQEVKGFARVVLGGGALALSAACVTSDNGQTDELWLLVLRDGVKEIWRMAEWRNDGDDVRDAFFVDAGVTVQATGGQNHFSGLDHLAGKDVAVLANGCVIDGMAVSETGTLDLPPDFVPGFDYVMTVGLSFTATATTLPIEVRTARGSIQWIKQRVVKLALRLLETSGIRVGRSGSPLENLIERRVADEMDGPTSLFSGVIGATIGSNTERDGSVTLVSDAPLPAIIIAAMPRIDADDTE